MKHLFAGIVAIAFVLGMASCKQKSEAPAAETAGQAETEQVETKQLTAEEIVEKAKAEGGNWSVDEWKSATRDMMTALQPVLSKLGDLLAQIEKDPAAAVNAMTQVQELENEFKPMEGLLNQFEEIAKSTKNGKIVMDDEEWGKELKKELGLPGDM